MSNKEYKIWFKGQYYIVSEELQRFYNKSERRIKYIEDDIKRENIEVDKERGFLRFIPSREDSFDRLVENGLQFKGEISDMEESIINKVALEKAMSKLSDSERNLIYEFYYLDIPEQVIAKRIGVTQQNINKIKKRILYKLHKLLEV